MTRNKKLWLTLISCAALALLGCGEESSPNQQQDAGTSSDSVVPADDATVLDAAPIKTPCNNNKLDTGEECDGKLLNNKTCQSEGFTGGQLSCTSTCTLDTSGCTNDPPTSGFGQICGNGLPTCPNGLTCVLASETNTGKGYCTAECSQTVPCPTQPPGAQCAFQLQGGKTVCGFLCSPSNPSCPTGLTCSYSAAGDYYYCTTDAPAKCGNNKSELQEECDGTDMSNLTCASFGYQSGTLKCAGCKLDKSGCVGATSCSNLPPRDCQGTSCSQLENFPTQGTGFNSYYPAQFRWLRKDTTMLVKYAAAAVACLKPGSYPISLGDMSMQDGSTPAENGQPRHPTNTHVGGLDIDIAYYQIGQQNNWLRPVCEHAINGVDQYHCVSAPSILDIERHALFIGKLMESPRVRVIGVDGKVGPLIRAEAQKLHSQGLITTAALNKINGYQLAFEQTDTGQGWFQFHHHHTHLSTLQTRYNSTAPQLPPFEAQGVTPATPQTIWHPFGKAPTSMFHAQPEPLPQGAALRLLQQYTPNR
ncbi:MAG: hypothetical protein H6707_20810 [Deltaproteobacteria bacterium]|nr:hypothetical protein [Deltaproteobacteria bacterium]